MFGGNSITNTSSMAAGNGVTALLPDGAPVQAHGTASAFSYFGQLDAGLAWDITRNWSLSIGYRIVGLANFAQSDASWPTIVTAPVRCHASTPPAAHSSVAASPASKGGTDLHGPHGCDGCAHHSTTLHGRRLRIGCAGVSYCQRSRTSARHRQHVATDVCGAASRHRNVSSWRARMASASGARR